MQQDFDKIRDRILGNNPTVRGLVIRFVLSVAFFFGLLFGLLQIADWFGWQYLKTVKRSDLLILLGEISLALTFIYLIIYLYVEYREKENLQANLESSQAEIKRLSNKDKSKSDEISELPDALVELVKQAHKHRDYAEVIRLGQALSRPLWLSGQYQARIAIGKLMEEAAALIGEYRVQAEALIDDLGWTNVVLRDLKAAEDNITHGIELATSNNLPSVAAKGKRHLGHIHRMRGEYNVAKKFFEEAKLHASKEENEKLRDEMLAGINYAFAELYTSRGEYEEALKESMQAKAIYEKSDDNERLVKSLSQLGDNFVNLGEFARAKDIYRQGLRMSRELTRRDEIAKNLLALGRIYRQEGDYSQAKLALAEAVILLKAMGKNKELSEAENIMVSIPNKTQR